MNRLNSTLGFLRRFALALLAGFFFLNLVLSAGFAYALTHPGCPQPQPLPGLAEHQTHILTTFDGHVLNAWYYPSQNGAAVIALGGLNGSLGAALPAVQPLIEAGYGVLQIESRACADPVAAVTLGARETQDALVALDFLLERPEVQPDSIGLMGFSMGAAAAIRAVAQEPRFAALAAEDPYANLGQHWLAAGEGAGPLLQIPLYSSLLFLVPILRANPFKLSPLEDMEQIAPRPIFLLYSEGSADSGRAEAMLAAAPQPAELWIVPGSRHGDLSEVAGQEYNQRLLAFFERSLLSD